METPVPDSRDGVLCRSTQLAAYVPVALCLISYLSTVALSFFTFVFLMKTFEMTRENPSDCTLCCWLFAVAVLVSIGVSVGIHRGAAFMRRRCPAASQVSSLPMLFVMPLLPLLLTGPWMRNIGSTGARERAIVGLVAIFGLIVLPLLPRAYTGLLRLVRFPMSQGHLRRAWLLILSDVAVAVAVTVCVSIGATSDFAHLGNLSWATRTLFALIAVREALRILVLHSPRYYDEALVRQWDTRLLWAVFPVVLYLFAAQSVTALFPQSDDANIAFVVLSCILVAIQGLNLAYLPTLPPPVTTPPAELAESRQRQTWPALTELAQWIVLPTLLAILL